MTAPKKCPNPPKMSVCLAVYTRVLALNHSD